MSYQRPLSQEQISQLLEGQVDVLTPMAQKDQAFFRHSTCPSCGSYDHSQYINPSHPFSQGSPLPNTLLKCSGCGTEFDPHSRIITAVPTTESD